jgi:hypothetical protein
MAFGGGDVNTQRGFRSDPAAQVTGQCPKPGANLPAAEEVAQLVVGRFQEILAHVGQEVLVTADDRYLTPEFLDEAQGGQDDRFSQIAQDGAGRAEGGRQFSKVAGSGRLVPWRSSTTPRPSLANLRRR